MHTSFALGGDSWQTKEQSTWHCNRKVKWAACDSDKSENPDFPCVFLRANSAVINRRPRANACYVKLLLITVTFFFFYKCPKKSAEGDAERWIKICRRRTATILRLTKEKRNTEKLKFKVSNQGVGLWHSAVNVFSEVILLTLTLMSMSS